MINQNFSEFSKLIKRLLLLSTCFNEDLKLEYYQ